MNSSIKIESPQGLEHFQKMNMESEAFGKVLGELATTPTGTAFTVTVTKDERPMVFNCDTSLKIDDLLRLAASKKRKRNTATA